MPRRIPQRVFDPARPLFVRRPFIANGRRYPIGATFDWRRASYDQRRVRQLFDAGRLDHVPVAFPGAAGPSPVPDTSRPPEPATTPAAEEGSDPPPGDGLDYIDAMVELRQIAEAEGAPFRVSKADQRAAIREHRRTR